MSDEDEFDLFRVTFRFFFFIYKMTFAFYDVELCFIICILVFRLYSLYYIHDCI